MKQDFGRFSSSAKKQDSRRSAPSNFKGRAAARKPTPDLAGPPPTGWLLQSPPGLATVLTKELNFVGAIERRQNIFINRQRNHDLLFINRLRSDQGLPRLRTAEMILFCPVFGRFKISQRQLGTMAEALKELGPRRLVVSVTGKHFQRHDLLRYIEREMSAREYSFDEKIEDEVWLFCIDEAYYFGVPVRKARETEGRETRALERVGSLPPPVAAALAFTVAPRADDVVWDPCCGSGTLLAEFHAYAPTANLTGFDIDPEAVEISRANLPTLAKIEVRDSRASELADSSVTCVLANLPFGIQFGKLEDNPKLYADLLREIHRVAHPTNFRGLLFTSDVTSLEKAVREVGHFTIEDAIRVKVRGEPATGFKLTKKG